MNTKRAILSGSLVWLLIFSVFTVLSFIPGIKDSLTQQGLIISLCIIPFASWGTAIYYKKGDIGNGLSVGIVMVATALILDVFITVPLVEIPHGGSYTRFFADPLLWILVVENIAVIYAWWKLKINRTMALTN